MSFGILPAGFVPMTLDDVKADLEAAFRIAFGATIDLSSEGPFGQIIGIMSERYADLWALGQAAYVAATVDGAIGAALDALAALTGTVRIPASSSTVTLTATGTAGTVLASGRIASVTGIGTRFVTTAPATIAAATAWANTTAYTLGQRRKNSSRVYEVITAGTSAGSGGPTTTAADITDGTVHWRYLGDGVGYVDVAATASLTGPLQALSGTITTIETPVSGWAGVTNTLDADLGADLETDAALRLRREEELRQTGKGSLDAIRDALLAVTGVVSATVFENNTDTTDADGVPPHSVEAMVRGGTDADIREALFASVAAGIYTHGGTSGTVTDSEGVSHTIRFTRPTEINIYVIINATVDSGLYPSDGGTQVKAAIVAFGDAQKGGKDAVASGIASQAFKVAGMLDAVALIGTAPSPATSVTVAISKRQLAVFDTSRITVTATPGTP